MSVAIHATLLWIALLIFRGVPVLAWRVLFLSLSCGGHWYVALPWLASATLLPGQKQKPVWDRRAMDPFVIAGSFETLGILLGILALSVGQIVIVSPIIATSPVWIVLGSWLFLRDNRTVNGADSSRCCLRAGGNDRDFNCALMDED
ncbi:MAG: hypothetical protein ACTHMB_09385 [Candidatus Binatia bacterium]